MIFLQILVSLKPLTWLKLIFRATEMWKITTFTIFQKALFLAFYSNMNLVRTIGEIA